MLKVLGYHYTTNADGKKVTTLQVAENYNDYYANAEGGRGCAGQKVDSIYVGVYDCSSIKVGSEIEIYYEKAINSKNGLYQPIKQIEILK